MNQPITGHELRLYAESLGIELFGVASAANYSRRFPQKAQPDLFIKSPRSIVVVGVPFEPTTMASVLRADELVPFYDETVRGGGNTAFFTHGGPAGTWFLSDEKANIYRELSWIGYKLTKWLRRRGHSAFYFSINKKDIGNLRAPFEHMPAAYCAGLGTLGLNCCILTRDFGPRVLITSIITDCELECGTPMEDDLCTECNLCVKRCPVNALDGNRGMDRFKCLREGRCCGICIAVCPVGELKVPKW